MKKLFAAFLVLCLLLAGTALGENAFEGTLAEDFTLTDLQGNTHTLSEYRGKVVFLNFWGTWCYWCLYEMPHMEELYHELGENQGDYVILGVSAPGTGHETEDITDGAAVAAFLEKSDMTISYPILIDPDGSLFDKYVTEGYPTSLFIRTDGTIQFYVPGAMEKENMMDAFRQTLEASGK